jgi:hypothetical protein
VCVNVCVRVTVRACVCMCVENQDVNNMQVLTDLAGRAAASQGSASSSTTRCRGLQQDSNAHRACWGGFQSLRERHAGTD